MKYDQLLQAVQSAAGLRLRLRLQPEYGRGEIIFPPIFSGGGYLISLRRIPEYRDFVYHKEDGERKTIFPQGSVPCAILDSVQSQANRMEAALVEDIRNGNLKLPHAVTDFTGVQGLEKEIGKLSSLETPHRIFDAIIRDSELDGIPFPNTEVGKAVVGASTRNATAIFQYDPTSLLFGSWDSTGVSGGLGEKFTRCVVSELVAVNVEQAPRGAGRVDPLNASKNVAIVRSEKNKLEWSLAENEKAKGVVRPSEINHGNIPPSVSEFGGVTCDYVSQSSTISFAALRQLQFPVKGYPGAAPCAHAVLAAIALHAAALNVEKGWHLRSRCDLVLEEGADLEWELLGNSPARFHLESSVTRSLLESAIAEAKKAGLPMEESPLELKPSKSLAALVRKSQQLQRDSAE